MKILAAADLTALSQAARQSPRFRANSNLHQELTDPIQRLAIAMEPATLIPPHRHPQTWEILMTLRGRFTVLLFEDDGTVAKRAVLGADSSVVEVPVGGWHAVLSHDTGGVIFEVKHGPYRPIGEIDIAKWSAGLTAKQMTEWYAVARVGEKYS